MDMKLLEKFKRNRILVIGDVMLDEYQYGTVNRISPEAPVPVFLLEGIEYRLGGAANVAVNMATNNQDVTIMAVIGDDHSGEIVRKLLKDFEINDKLLLTEEGRPTSRKCRLLAGNNQQVLRIDRESTNLMEEETYKRLLAFLAVNISDFDMLVLSDYMKGFLNLEFTEKVIRLAMEKKVRVLSDVKDCRLEKYKNSFIIKPNIKELNMLTSMPVGTEEEIRKASEFLREKCNSDYVITTCGSKGMMLVGRNKEYYRINTSAHEVYDVTGAGDTVIAFLAMALASGEDIIPSIVLANYAAGVQVSRVGTSAVRLNEVYNISGNSILPDYREKKIEREKLHKLRAEWNGKKVVFTNGCFDILHIGHLRFLKQAASLGDIFIVGLNSDQSIKKIKGERRPVNSVEDRIEMLAFFDFIDGIIVFDEDTPFEVISECQPDILVKGGDYKLDDIIGRDIVEKKGGVVCILPYMEGKSTTNIISKIRLDEK